MAQDAPPSGLALLRAGARGECPQCGASTLFDGPVRFAPRCRVCGLDYTRYNVGDGPAAILTLVVGALMLALALAVEAAFHPPIIVHVILWLPLTILAVVGSLRVAKGVLLTLEHRNEAREGRVADRAGDPPASS